MFKNLKIKCYFKNGGWGGAPRRGDARRASQRVVLAQQVVPHQPLLDVRHPAVDLSASRIPAELRNTSYS